MNKENLDQLRSKVEHLDRQIVDLLARRLDVVLEIGDIKSSLKIPIRDYRVEREVSQRMQDRCRELEIDPAVGMLLARLLIESAIRVQERVLEPRYSGTLKRILVVGGCGRMGQWFCHYLKSMGHRVSVFDPRGPLENYDFETDLSAAASKSDMILLSAPLGASGDVLEEVLSHQPRGIIFDICSLKSHLLERIRAGIREGYRISSLHPMYGPAVRTLLERNVILCRCGCPGADAEVRKLFEGTEANLLEMSIEEHDERMAYVLGMSHALNLIFSDMLLKSGKPLRDLLRVASSTFAKQIETTRDVAFDSPQLYYEIQVLNKHTPEVFDLFRHAMNDVQRAVHEKDFARFSKIMERGRAYFREVDSDVERLS